jgi:hypothetical protein
VTRIEYLFDQLARMTATPVSRRHTIRLLTGAALFSFPLAGGAYSCGIGTGRDVGRSRAEALGKARDRAGRNCKPCDPGSNLFDRDITRHPHFWEVEAQVNCRCRARDTPCVTERQCCSAPDRCISGTCCPPPNVCAIPGGGFQCCPPGRPCCGGTGCCLKERCCDRRVCCEKVCCRGKCCSPREECCGGQCCPVGRCCEGKCCWSGLCCGGKCCPSLSCCGNDCECGPDLRVLRRPLRLLLRRLRSGRGMRQMPLHEKSRPTKASGSDFREGAIEIGDGGC